MFKYNDNKTEKNNLSAQEYSSIVAIYSDGSVTVNTAGNAITIITMLYAIINSVSKDFSKNCNKDEYHICLWLLDMLKEQFLEQGVLEDDIE